MAEVLLVGAAPMAVGALLVALFLPARATAGEGPEAARAELAPEVAV